MNMKYIVRLTEEERRICAATIDKLKGTSCDPPVSRSRWMWMNRAGSTGR